MSNIRSSPFSVRHLCGLVVLVATSACQTLPPSIIDDTHSQKIAISSADARKIDHLLELMDQRLNVAPKVAKSKWNSGAAVDDPKREAQILDGVTAQADALGNLDKAFLRGFFQNQFDAGKIIQRKLLSGWRSTLPNGYKFDDAPDLALEVRPVLDKLTPELIVALRDVVPLLRESVEQAYLAHSAKAIIRNDEDGDVRRQALVALDALWLK